MTRMKLASNVRREGVVTSLVGLYNDVSAAPRLMVSKMALAVSSARRMRISIAPTHFLLVTHRQQGQYLWSARPSPRSHCIAQALTVQERWARMPIERWERRRQDAGGATRF